jgi:vanillate/4-hydroxybenzoate decarboxylase subunit D
MNSYPRPTESTLSVDREHVEGKCPECGEQELRRYPVLSEGGWWMAVKCPACLASVEREPWNRLGSISLLSDNL